MTTRNIFAEGESRSSHETHSGLPTLDLAELAAKDPSAKSYLLAGVIPFGEFGVLAGPGGVGKSLAAGQIAVAGAAGGGVVLGMKIEAVPVVYLSLEDGEDEVHFRLSKLCAGLGVDMARLAGSLHIVCRRGELDNELGRFDHQGTFKPSQFFNELCDLVERTQSKLVVLDNVAHLFSGNENDRREVTRFCSLLAMLAHLSGAAVLLVAHPPKNEARYSGSTAWENAARFRLSLVKPDELDPDLRALSVDKSNYGPTGEVARFRWYDWHFVRDEDLAPSVVSRVREVSRINAANDAFMACLAEAEAQGRNVSHSGSTNFAPKVFAKMTKGKGFSAAEFEAAMERLLHLGVILADQEVGRYSNRSPKRGLKVAQSAAQSGAQGLHNGRTNGAQSPHNRAHAQPPSPTEMDGGANDWPAPSPSDLDWGADERPDE